MVIHQADDSWSVLQDLVYLQLIALWPGVYTEGEATVAVASERGYEGRQERESPARAGSDGSRCWRRAC